MDHSRRALLVFIERHRDHVEAVAGRGRPAPLGQVKTGGADHTRLLARTNRLEGVSGHIPRTRADLAKNAGPVTVEGDQIELTLGATPVALDDSKAGTFQLRSGQILCAAGERRASFERARQGLGSPGRSS